MPAFAAALLLARTALAGPGELDRPKPLEAARDVFLSAKVKPDVYKASEKIPDFGRLIHAAAPPPPILTASAVSKAETLAAYEEPAGRTGAPPEKDRPEGKFARLLNKYRNAAAGLVAPSEDAARLEALRARLIVVTRGDEAQKAREAYAIHTALARLMKSPTAQTLAERLIRQGTKVRVSFANIKGAPGTETNGKKVLEKMRGLTFTREPDKVHVVLNEEYLKTDPIFQSLYFHVTLGHELLGHAPRHLNALQAGLLPFYTRSSYDETQARLVGWLIAAETLKEIEDYDMWNYLRDPEELHQVLSLRNDTYALSLSGTEMRDPPSVLKERLERTRREIKSVEEEYGNAQIQQMVIDHFISDHGVEAALFESLKGELNQDIEIYLRLRFEQLHQTARTLEGQLKFYATEDGKKEYTGLQKAAESPFFKEVGAEIEAFTTRLRLLTRGKSPQTIVAPPIQGQLTWKDLVAMKDDDQKVHPEFWKTLKTLSESF